jgi:hypothetical protein
MIGLIDYLVGTTEQPPRYRDAKRLAVLIVDDQFGGMTSDSLGSAPLSIRPA